MFENNQQFKDALHEAMRTAGLDLVADYLMSLRADGSIDDKRKAVELVIRTLGAETDKKQTGDNLPVFNIVFQNGGMQVSPVDVVDVQVTETPADPPAQRQEALSPPGEGLGLPLDVSTLLRASAVINAELDLD